jgi:peptidoglycan/LPS O-acetylase OafA/YrhL
MGYQPSLDGLRALSVAVVLLYHAGFSWMRGGFFGVEVFFVVSGFLITSLLLDETERDGHVSFRHFWLRRARRLFPALYAVLLAVALWAAVAGSPEQQSQLRRDIPWSILYVNNWGQILGNVPYFAGEPPLLRHLWSLAVEEQWYVIWPLVFVALLRVRLPRHVLGAIVIAAAFVVFAYMFWVHAGTPTPLGGPPAAFDGVDRTNFLYLSTITRSGGLLLGAGMAFLWRPWRSTRAADAPAGKVLDPLGAAAVAMLGCASAVAVLTDGYVYQWLLPLVSILSLVAVMVAVHPAALGFRRMMSWTPLVEMGKRSYGLYLWSWPISVIVGATTGSVSRFVWAMALTVVIAEASYRYLETPVRRGAIGRWWQHRSTVVYWPAAGGVALVGVLVVFYANVEQFNRFEGGDDAVFDLDVAVDDPAASTDGTQPADGSLPIGSLPAEVASPAVPATSAPPVASATSARLAIVGDSQANALAINLPDGIEGVFPDVVNGSVDGCSVYDSGSVRSSVSSATTSRSARAGRRSGPTLPQATTSRWSSWARGTCSTSTTAARCTASRRRTAMRCSCATSPRASTRCWPRGRTSHCSKWPACAPRTWREPVSGRCPNAVTTPASPTSTGCSATLRRRTTRPASSSSRVPTNGAPTRRSPPTSATGGTACTSTSPAPT